MRADGTPRASYVAVKAAIAKTGGRCVGKLRRWRHAKTVEGADAGFQRHRRLPSRVNSWSFVASAAEDASFTAGIYRVHRGRGRTRVLSEKGRLAAHVARHVRFPKRRLAPGRYVYSIRFRAAANPQRTTPRTSRVFRVDRRR
jgi:hypothetical protein